MSHYHSQVREVINRNTMASLALERGFNVFLPVYDGGVDFILYREIDGTLYKVQLKSRWTIDKKYLERDIWIAFPVADVWYLMPHDMMVETAGPGILGSVSWRRNGLYSRAKLSASVIAECSPYRFRQMSREAAPAGAQPA